VCIQRTLRISFKRDVLLSDERLFLVVSRHGERPQPNRLPHLLTGARSGTSNGTPGAPNIMVDAERRQLLNAAADYSQAT